MICPSGTQESRHSADNNLVALVRHEAGDLEGFFSGRGSATNSSDVHAHLPPLPGSGGDTLKKAW